MDFEGNENQKFQAHQATVNDLSVDLDGEYIASASDDGNTRFNNAMLFSATLGWTFSVASQLTF